MATGRHMFGMSFSINNRWIRGTGTWHGYVAQPLNEESLEQCSKPLVGLMISGIILPFIYWGFFHNQQGIPFFTNTRPSSLEGLISQIQRIRSWRPGNNWNILEHNIWVNLITTSLFSLTGIMVRIREIIPKWPNYSG